MAIYSTFFLARPEELASGFPGWKLPLPAPVRREFRNAFTRQVVTIETREPEWPDEEQLNEMPQFRGMSLQGPYGDYLENRLPSFIRQQRHWAAKGLTDIEVEPLLGAIGAGTKLESPIYSPPSSGAVLREFPADFIPKLIKCDRLEIARQWAADMSAPQHTHSVTDNKLSNGRTTEQASQILCALIALAQKATPVQRMYLLIEP